MNIKKGMLAGLFLSFTLLHLGAQATAKLVTKKYADHVFQSYSTNVELAKKLDQDIKKFLAKPSKESMETAKTTWIEVRKFYSETEVFRFYGGPIDSEDGPEGLINAWPLDENYIDYVLGKPNSGIINNTAKYPQITQSLLEEINEKDGEKNVSTGWHAIEFLLWGQDVSAASAGRRPFTDYVIGRGKNAERRRTYLALASSLLIQHLSQVRDQWNPMTPGSYYNLFLSDPKALNKAFTGIGFMASEELSVERLFVALDTQLQEDEHSCFSDTTMNDIYHNFSGIRIVWQILSSDVAAIKTTVAAKTEVDNLLASIDRKLAPIQVPFDIAILDPTTRPVLMEVVTLLQDLGSKLDKIKENL